MGAQDQRPRFYEGQYLSADDLAAIVEYLRGADARHALGAHAWGIAIGLHLIERNAPGAPERREVILQPGFAWDGFGRAIVVARPTRLQERDITGVARIVDLDDPAAPGGLKGRLIKVWLEYRESATRPPAAGFETCATDDQNARVLESFRFVFGDMPAVDQRARLSVGGQTVDAADAIKHFDGSSTVVHDTSIPHQSFPAGKPPRWLVPVGYVRWVALDDSSGYFAKLDLVASDKARQRAAAFRRYLGVVAEDVAAAHRAIVMRRRDDNPKAPHHYAALMSDPARVDELQKDLVWVEGNLRVRGDEKINGGVLHFRNEDGDDKRTPLFLARHGDGQAADGNRELRVVIGDDAQKDATNNPQRDNKLIVGPLAEPAAPTDPPTVTPCLVVVSNGNVGVNTGTPVAKLEVKGNWTGDEGAVRITGDKPTIRFSGGPSAGNENWILHLGSDGPGNFQISHREAPSSWKAVVNVTPSLRVGIGTPNPRNPLAVRGAGTSEELISFEALDGTTKWHLNQNLDGDKPGLNFAETGVADGRLFLKAGGNVGIGTTDPQFRLDVPTGWFRFGPGGDGGRIFAEYGPQLAPILKLSDFDDPPRIQFQQVGTGDEQNPQFSAWIGMARGLSNDLAMMNANVGIGTTTPGNRLQISGGGAGSVDLRVNGRIHTGDAGNSGGVWLDNGQTMFVGQNNTNVGFWTQPAGWNAFQVTQSGNVGINTTTPSAKLEVNGDLTVRSTARKPGGGHWTAISDERLKTRIESLVGALDTLLRLRGVRFEWREPEKLGVRAGPQMGLVAQETEKVLPEWVGTSPDGYKELTMTGFEALVIEALRELNAKCERLEAEVADLRAQRGSSAAPKPKKSPTARDRD